MLSLATDVRLRQVPPLGATAHDADPLVRCRILIPGCVWAWYPLEFDGREACYGFVDGDFPEYGSFTLPELAGYGYQVGAPPQCDPAFTPCRLSELRARVHARAR
jgi:hypothetical protein